MPAEPIKQQYQSLETLLKTYRQSTLGTEHIQQTLSFCDKLLSLAKNHPDAVFAQSQLYKSKLPYVLNLCFNTCLLTCLIGVRNKLNHTTNQQLMCGAINLFVFEQVNIEKHYNKNQPAIKLGTINERMVNALCSSRQDCWLAAYQMCTTVHQFIQEPSPDSNALCKEQSIISIAARLALLSTDNARFKKLSFAQALRHITLHCPDNWQALLHPLVDYPSLTPPGTYIKLAEQRYAIVLAIAEQGHFVKELTNLPSNTTPQPANLLTNKRLTHSYVAQSLSRFGQIDHWWSRDWQEQNNTRNDRLINPLRTPFNDVYKLDKPPTALLAIQTQLNQTEPDIHKLTRAIRKEPAFVQYLQKSASQAARKKLPAMDIQHSLMMHGFERSGSILMQHALLSRLNQNYFPLQQHFINFTQLRGHIAGSLAQQSGLFTFEQACSLAYFATAGLFTHPALKIQKRWLTKSTRLFDINQLDGLKGNEQLHKHAVILAQAWQQNSENLLALRMHNMQPEKMSGTGGGRRLAMLLGLSLISTRALYFSHEKSCTHSEHYLKCALKLLNISPLALGSLQQQSVSYCHSYQPLD